MSEPICENTLLPASMCAHCTPPSRGTYDLIPDSEIVARFPAKFDKEMGCDLCGGDTEEGEPLCRTRGGDYVHAEHCEDKPGDLEFER